MESFEINEEIKSIRDIASRFVQKEILPRVAEEPELSEPLELLANLNISGAETGAVVSTLVTAAAPTIPIFACTAATGDSAAIGSSTASARIDS